VPLQERAGQGHSLRPVGWQPGWGQGPGCPAARRRRRRSRGRAGRAGRGPRANPGRLEDAEEPGKGEDAEEEGDDDTDLRPLMADKDDGISCELGIRYPMLQAILSGDKNRQTIQAGSI